MADQGSLAKIKELEYGKIVAEKEYDGSDVSLIIVGEYHHKKDVQLDVFRILEEIRNYTGFDLLLLEGMLCSQEKWGGFPYPFMKDYESLVKSYGDLNDDLTHDDYLARGPPVFGYINRDNLQTWGVETKRWFRRKKFLEKDERCEELSLRKYHKGRHSLTEKEHEELDSLLEFVKETLIREASFDFVDTSLKIMRRLGKNLAVISVGSSHTDTMTERLDMLNISYKYVLHKSLDNYTVLVEYYLAERKMPTAHGQVF